MLTELLTAIQSTWDNQLAGPTGIPLYYQELPQDKAHDSEGNGALPPLYAVYFAVPRTPVGRLMLGGARMDDTLIQFSVFASQTPGRAKQVSPLAALGLADEITTAFDNVQLRLSSASSTIITMRRSGVWPDTDPDGGYVVHIEYQVSSFTN